MSNDLRTQIGGLFRRVKGGAEALGAEIQRQAPGALEQVRRSADVALSSVAKTIEDAARAAEQAGILPQRRFPDAGTGAGESPRATQYGRRVIVDANDTLPAGDMFELGAQATRVTVRLSDLGGENVYAVVSHPLWPPVRLRVVRDGGGYAGSSATNDGTLVRLVIDATGACTASFGNNTSTLKPSAERAESWRVRFGVNRGDELSRRIGELTQGPLSETQRAALTALASGEVSKRGGSRELAELIGKKTDLTPAQAAAIPLFHAWVASDESLDPVRLAALFTAALAAPAIGADAHAMGERVLDASRAMPPNAPPESAWAVVLAGLLATASVLERDPADPLTSFRALVDGTSPALRLLIDATAGQPYDLEAQAQAWSALAQLMCRSLPVGAMRNLLAGALDRAKSQQPDVACRTFSTTLADVLRLSRGEAKATENSSGLPLLPATHTVAPVHVKRFSSPLIAAEGARWQDVAQRESFLDCGLASAWIALVHARPDIVGRLIHEVPGDQRKFSLTMHFPEANGGFRKEEVPLDDRLFASDDGAPVFGTSRVGEASDPASLWFAIAEKAFAQSRQDVANYAWCEKSSPSDVWQMALGTTAVNVMAPTMMSPDELANELKVARAKGAAMVFGTHHDLESYRGSDLAGGHAYALLDVVERDGQTFVQLVNPRGATLPIAAGLANDVHLAAVDMDRRYGIRNERRGYLELPIERVTKQFTQCFWIDGKALEPAAG